MSRPIIALAPMADVTDPAFRRIIAKYGKPDLIYTEFVSADGLALAPKEGREKLLRDLIFTEAERPIFAQFFTAEPKHMKMAAELAVKLGFDGVDINMGCPDRSIIKQGAGAALIKNPKLAYELILSAKAGAPNLPVSVKTRLGFNKDELEEWLPALLKADPAHVIIHARTKKEMSKVPAHWDRVKRAVEIRDALDSRTLILGNGDLKSVTDARQRVRESGADGAMLGKAIFGNPWLFADQGQALRTDAQGLASRLEVMVEHTRAFEELLGDVKSFSIMKKHYKAYVNGFDGASDLRAKLMEAKDAGEVSGVVEDFLSARPFDKL